MLLKVDNTRIGEAEEEGSEKADEEANEDENARGVNVLCQHL